MKKRFIDVSAEAQQKRTERFDLWIEAEGIPFGDKAMQAAYRERANLIKDAVQLEKVPTRIPICPSAGFFPNEYAGISMYDAMYDYAALGSAWESYHLDLAPDRTSSDHT